MKMRGLMVGMIAAGLAGMVGGAKAAERIEIVGDAMPEIKVDGPSSMSPYALVTTKTLELVVSARSNKERQATMWIFKEHDQHYSQYGTAAYLDESWKKFKLTAPYYDLDPVAIANERVSPIEL